LCGGTGDWSLHFGLYSTGKIYHVKVWMVRWLLEAKFKHRELWKMLNIVIDGGTKQSQLVSSEQGFREEL